jgi:hypothetical protein
MDEARRQNVGLEVVKLAAACSVRSQDIVEGPATTQAKEETIHSWRTRGVGAPPILGNFACTDRKRRKVAVAVFDCLKKGMVRQVFT